MPTKTKSKTKSGGVSIDAVNTQGGVTIVDSLPNILPNALVNSYSVLTIPAYWRAMNYIANNMASFPRSVINDNVTVDHNITPLITIKPNAYQSSYVFWRQLFFARSHTGNGYAHIIRDSQFRPIELHQHLPELVWPFRWSDEDGNLSQWYYVAGRNPKVVPFADMIHLQGLSYDGQKGMSPVTMLYEAFERARHVNQYITRYLVKGGVIRGAIEIPTGVSPQQQEALRTMIATYFDGGHAENDVLILGDGAKLNNASLNNEQSQTVQLSALTTKQISQATGVPPACLFEIEKYASGATEQQMISVVRDLFRPLIISDEDELSSKLLSNTDLAAGLRVQLDVSDLVRGDTATVSNVTIAQKVAGIITENEARKELGYDRVDDPTADQLSTLGGTNNPPPAADPSEPASDRKEDAPAPEQHARPALPDRTAFAALLDDATARTSTKTAKALETAKKRHGDDVASLTRWGNVFAAEQAKFAADAVRPILSALASLGADHINPDLTATDIGERYGASVRAVVAGYEAHDLGQIVNEILDQHLGGV